MKKINKESIIHLPLIHLFSIADGCCCNMIKATTSKFEEESLHIFSEYSHVCHTRLRFPLSLLIASLKSTFKSDKGLTKPHHIILCETLLWSSHKMIFEGQWLNCWSRYKFSIAFPVLLLKGLIQTLRISNQILRLLYIHTWQLLKCLHKPCSNF